MSVEGLVILSVLATFVPAPRTLPSAQMANFGATRSRRLGWAARIGQPKNAQLNGKLDSAAINSQKSRHQVWTTEPLQRMTLS